MHPTQRIFSILLLYCTFYIALVVTIPTWQGLNGRYPIGSLVPGVTYIEALGPVRDSGIQTKYLSVQMPGQSGNLTIAPNIRAPPLFYINRNQLWQYNNETAIYHVNLVNVTKTGDFPLQLILGKKKTGVNDGIWRWQGTMLYYDLGSKGNMGLYYNCQLQDGSTGIFMFLQPSRTPPECETLTLHTFSRTE